MPRDPINTGSGLQLFPVPTSCSPQLSCSSVLHLPHGLALPCSPQPAPWLGSALQEQFSQADVAELVASTTSSTQTLITASGAEERAPAAYFMAGLHLRFDRGVWQAASGPGGIQERVGRPVLYQAHASIVEGSLFDLGERAPL